MAETRSTDPEEMLMMDDSSKKIRKDPNDIAGPSTDNQECKQVADILEKFLHSGKRNKTRLMEALSEFRRHLISCLYCEEIFCECFEWRPTQARRRSF